MTLAVLPVVGALALRTDAWITLAMAAAVLGALTLTIVAPSLRSTTPTAV